MMWRAGDWKQRPRVQEFYLLETFKRIFSIILRWLFVSFILEELTDRIKGFQVES